MTNKEAIETIKMAIAEVEWEYPMDYAVAFEKAIEALEKQIPRKPANKSGGIHIENCDIVLCPRCDKRLKLKSKGKYCDKCGQKLDWGEGE